MRTKRSRRSKRSGASASARKRRPVRKRRTGWARLPEEQLLDLRLCDLGVKIESTWLEERTDRLYEELERRGLRFRPHFWLSDEWFTPDGIPGVAIPFYLAHPRLMKLEEKLLLEAEGGTNTWCMKILRHETGHAIDNAYRLRRKRSWQKVFGKSSVPYPESYQPKPFSRRYVIHLDYWYAQSHPCEDFAETFAVWLGSPTSWRRRYRNWPALKKLEYVDALMKEIGGRKPLVSNHRVEDPIHRIRTTLRKHYEEKRRRYGVDYPQFYDADLRKLFSDAAEYATCERATRFLQRMRRELRRLVARWTGQYQYTIDQVLKEMIERSSELKLHVHKPEAEARLEAAILLSVQTMNYLHGGHHRIAL